MVVANSKPKRGTNPILAALQILQKIAPPQTLIHIGAGTGTGNMQEWQEWQVPNVWIIDANANRLQWAETLVAKYPDWHVASAVLAETEGEAEFHQASNPDEDSLISPERLQAVWPNLQAKGHELRPVRRLDKVLAETNAAALSPWLFVDCLPALPIIKGAGKYLESCSVLWLRTLLMPLASTVEGATLQALEVFLQPLGFRCIEITEGNHPALGHALFVRDWQSALQPQITELSKAKAEQSKLAAERQAQLDQVSKAKDEQGKLAAERFQQLETANKAKAILEQEKAALTTKHDELQKEVTAVVGARSQQTKLAGELQAQITQLTRIRDEQTKLVAEQQSQIDELSKSKDEQEKLATERQTQIAQLTKARDEQARLLNQLKAELEQAKNLMKQKEAKFTQLAADMAERDARQQMLNDEVIRAEAQIDLIKDVLLREPGL